MTHRRIKTYRRTASRTECQTTLPEAYQMSTEKQTDILAMLSTEMAKRSWPRTHRSYHRNDSQGEPTKCRIKRCRNPHMQSGFPRVEARSYRGEYDHLLWSLGVRYGSMTYRPRLMQLAHRTTLKWPPAWVTYESQRLWRCQERKLTSLPKGKARRRCKWLRDWVHWDASYDRESTGRTCHDQA